MIAELTRAPAWRREGCGEGCELRMMIVPGLLGRQTVELHDPASHEEYGRMAVGSAPDLVVRTGSLAVDLRHKTVRSHGQEIALTAREWELLEYLASRAGILCPVVEIETALWGYVTTGHSVRVLLSRLRDKLGDNGALIETASNRGYRLMMVAPAEGGQFVPRRTGPWARHWDRCVCCGRTEWPHRGNGRCRRCTNSGNQRHHGPCGAPPAENAGV